ncbi:MAG: hypothetical protein IPJ88_15470 [Myxococcales bacterium]|nr:MAG: hypothetical protein IPJ88_15470 [Myxococcales bacterium]
MPGILHDLSTPGSDVWQGAITLPKLQGFHDLILHLLPHPFEDSNWVSPFHGESSADLQDWLTMQLDSLAMGRVYLSAEWNDAPSIAEQLTSRAEVAKEFIGTLVFLHTALGNLEIPADGERLIKEAERILQDLENAESLDEAQLLYALIILLTLIAELLKHRFGGGSTYINDASAANYIGQLAMELQQILTAYLERFSEFLSVEIRQTLCSFFFGDIVENLIEQDSDLSEDLLGDLSKFMLNLCPSDSS